MKKQLAGAFFDNYMNVELQGLKLKAMISTLITLSDLAKSV